MFRAVNSRKTIVVLLACILGVLVVGGATVGIGIAVRAADARASAASAQKVSSISACVTNAETAAAARGEALTEADKTRLMSYCAVPDTAKPVKGQISSSQCVAQSPTKLDVENCQDAFAMLAAPADTDRDLQVPGVAPEHIDPGTGSDFDYTDFVSCMHDAHTYSDVEDCETTAVEGE